MSVASRPRGRDQENCSGCNGNERHAALPGKRIGIALAGLPGILIDLAPGSLTMESSWTKLSRQSRLVKVPRNFCLPARFTFL